MNHLQSEDNTFYVLKPHNNCMIEGTECEVQFYSSTFVTFRNFMDVSSPRFLCRPTLFVRLAGPVGRQSALHKENSGFAATTLGWHISTFRGYQILFSIQNPYINRFTNHFSIHSQPSYPQKLVLHSITARFCLRPYHFAI